MIFRYTHPLSNGLALDFTWHGGEYIEVARAGLACSEVINVWDSYNGRPRIERTQHAFEEKCRDWIANYPEDSLIHDATVNW